MSLSNDLNMPPGASNIQGEKHEEKPDGTLNVENLRGIRDRHITHADAERIIREGGKDPDDYRIGLRSIAYGGDKFSNGFTATLKQERKGRKRFPIDELLESLESWRPASDPIVPEGGTFVITPADPQWGKVDWGGGHQETLERMMTSYSRAADICKKLKPAEILIAALGDDVENIYSVSSQRGTNDLALTEQIRFARRVALEGIKMLAPLTPKLTYASVPSNHGSVRVGPKSPENHVLDDYGIEIAEQLRDVVSLAPSLSNVEVVIPDYNHESLLIETSGTKIGMAHGHQANNADSLGKWWAGQSHGRMPLADADIALFGHFHSLRVQQSGNARWLFVSPASDSGSSWYTNKTGESSVSGMLSFVTRDGKWSDLRVL